MNRFKNILYMNDGQSKDCPAFERAVDLADLNDAKLSVVNVLKHVDDPQFDSRFGVSFDELLRQYCEQELDTLIGPYQNNNRDISKLIVSGSPFAEVIKLVMKNDYDLVIKASKPPSNLQERILGSTDMHLLRKCPSPVWIDRPGKVGRYRNILAAIDPFGDIDMAHKILQLTISLSEREKSDFQVIHAWHLYGESMLRSGFPRVPAKEVDKVVELEYNKRRQAFNSVLSKYGLSTLDQNVHLVEGDAVPSILKASETADLIVMGTVGRVGIPGLFIGNTAEDVMQSTQASILAVKPEGYISPLSQAS